jgi:hypothetical protein
LLALRHARADVRIGLTLKVGLPRCCSSLPFTRSGAIGTLYLRLAITPLAQRCRSIVRPIRTKPILSPDLVAVGCVEVTPRANAWQDPRNHSQTCEAMSGNKDLSDGPSPVAPITMTIRHCLSVILSGRLHIESTKSCRTLSLPRERVAPPRTT